MYRLFFRENEVQALRVQRTYSASATLLAGCEVLFLPNIKDSTTNKRRVSAGLNQFTSFTEFTISVGPNDLETWGALVRVDFYTASARDPIYDRLVGVFGNGIVLGSYAN